MRQPAAQDCLAPQGQGTGSVTRLPAAPPASSACQFTFRFEFQLEFGFQVSVSISGFGCPISGFWFRISGFGMWVRVFGFWRLGSGLGQGSATAPPVAPPASTACQFALRFRSRVSDFGFLSSDFDVWVRVSVFGFCVLNKDPPRDHQQPLLKL